MCVRSKGAFDVCLFQIDLEMTSDNSKQSEPIHVIQQSNETGLDFPLSPNEPGKFDFYR